MPAGTPSAWEARFATSWPTRVILEGGPFDQLCHLVDGASLSKRAVCGWTAPGAGNANVDLTVGFAGAVERRRQRLSSGALQKTTSFAA